MNPNFMIDIIVLIQDNKNFNCPIFYVNNTCYNVKPEINFELEFAVLYQKDVLIHETILNGRTIAIFRLNQPFKVYTRPVYNFILSYKSYLDHVEIIIGAINLLKFTKKPFITMY